MFEPVIKIENVTKTIGKKTIVKDISLEVFPGEVFGFIGPNGAGKTTTIRMMLGLMKITNGNIFINNHNVKTDFEKAVEKVGGIIESPELYKYMSGYRNLMSFARLRGITDKERIDSIIEFVGLKNRIHDKVKKYSLGMRQRLGVAQALLHKPNILVLDEPTNGLDPEGIKVLRDTFKRLAKEENVAVFVSSHLLSEMQLMCDRAAIIQNGRITRILDMHDTSITASNIQVLNVHPVEKAAEVLKRNGRWTINKIIDDELHIEAESEQVTEIIQMLVAENISIKSVRAEEKTLEDLFMESTGVNVID